MRELGLTTTRSRRHGLYFPDARVPHEADGGSRREISVYAGGPTGSALKRGLDLLLSATLLVLTAPVILLAMLAVKLEGRGPAIFVQRRIGHRCDELMVFKIRTMVHGAESMEEELAARGGGTFLKLVDDPRTTRVGRLLRKSSIDELPQLWNVLRGEMSLVGPRPILVSDFDRIPKREQWRRFTAKPGITGLWQVQGRSACSDEERMRLDLRYTEEWNPWLDVKILLKTVPVVLSGEGAS